VNSRNSAPGPSGRRGLGLAALALLFFACGGKEQKDPVAKGRSLYLVHCIACHNPNPSLDGSLGPAIRGSSLDLLRARALRAEYPPGYKPKRDTHIMPKLPLTEEDVANLHAFLNAPP
jgi:mono/diheme cytochrome c family protein